MEANQQIVSEQEQYYEAEGDEFDEPENSSGSSLYNLDDVQLQEEESYKLQDNEARDIQYIPDSSKSSQTNLSNVNQVIIRSGSIIKSDNFQQKNQDMIQKLMEKKKEEQAQKKRLENKKRRQEQKLRKRIVEEVIRMKEISGGENVDNPGEQNESDGPQSQQLQQTKGRRLRFKDIPQMYELVAVKGKYEREDLSEKQLSDLIEFESRISEEREQLQKLQKIYRSRQISFLEELKRKQEKKKQDEIDQKAKQDKILSKMKEQYDNVKTNIFAETELSRIKKIDKEQIKKSTQRASSAEGLMSKEDRRDNLKKIQQKNQDYLEKLKEKKLGEKVKEEEEKKKKELLKEKIKDFVLVNIKKDIENGVFFVDAPEKKPKKSRSKHPLEVSATISPKLQAVKRVDKLPKIRESNNENLDELEEEDEPGDEEGDASASDDQEGDSCITKRKLRKYPFIVDLELWKKKQRLPQDIKVFIVTGGYTDIKKSLWKRGWVSNPDTKSPCFNFRWSLQNKDIDYESLKDFQIVNHFQKSGCITTKVGLCKSLRNLVWHDNVDIDSFYPRCYDLNDVEDYENFVEEFKTTKAESILKRYMRMYLEKDMDIEKMKKQAVIALNVCERRARDLDEIIDDPNEISLVTKKEWNILSSDELSEEKLAQKKYDQWLNRIEGKKKDKPKKKKKPATKENTKGESKKKEEGEEEEEEDQEEEEDDDDDEETQLIKQMDEFTLKVHLVLKKYKEKYSQDTLNGEDNIWIIKPAGLSRGRGITCYNNLVEILDHVKSKESQWVIQKYIENPFIIKKRKFDIRVWVLVTDWNPLTIWHFEDCYVRFSVDDYDTDNLQNKFTHLTNNMISKLKQREEKDDISELGNMYYKENFMAFLKEKEGYDVFTDQIEPKMKHAIIMSLKSVQDTIENRKGSIEMYGYDFMIDDLYNTWLIEINSSPSMEYSTPVTERLVKSVSEDIVKTVVDYGMEKSKKVRKTIDTGAFKRIYKGKYVEEKSNSVGLTLLCEGVAMKKKKNNSILKVNTIKLS